MKRILSVLLATLMLLGVFAVGASALERPSLTEFKQSRFYVALPIPVSAQGSGSEADLEELLRILEEIEDDFLTTFATSWGMLSIVILEDNAKAYKAGKNVNGLVSAFNAMMLRVDASAAAKALDKFINDEEAVMAAFKDGTLAEKAKKLLGDYYALLESEAEKIANEFFLANAVNAIKSYADVMAILFKVETELTPAEQKAFAEKMAEFDIGPETFFNALDSGNWKEANQLINGFLKNLNKLAAEYGLVAAPSIGTRVWNFILRYFFFGWLWMK